MSRSSSSEAAAGDASGALVERLVQGDRRALARAITIVENDLGGASAILAGIQPYLGRARIVGVTGAPGVGKSTLINALIAELRRRGRTVGLLAVDPSSSLTGGAILGDRIRMTEHAEDEGVFIRSLASRGHLGGLFRTALGVIQVLDAAGPDVVILETVGAGQSEVEIATVAPTRVVVCAPGLGDDVQALKAGILEIADILVVNKSDRPDADETMRQLEAMLQLRDPQLGTAALVSTIAMTGAGVDVLADVLEATDGSGGWPSDPDAGIRRLLAERAVDALRRHVETAADPVVDALCARIRSGEIGLDAAAAELLGDLRR